MNLTPDPVCRLCAGHLTQKFRLIVLDAHDVGFFECDRCESLQTEDPHWLADAYDLNLSRLDTGAVQRNLQNVAAAYIVSKLFKAQDVLDVGGGDGLLCRLLRDYKVNCYVKDKYAIPTYGQGFSEPNFATPDMITAFEVIEHFAAPATELATLFESSPGILLASTAIYDGQQRDWWYLAADTGQHVFFYSKKAAQRIADRFGYSSVISGGYLLFVRKSLHSPIRRFIAGILLNRVICRLLRGIILIMPAPGIWLDHVSNKSKG